MKIHEPYYKLKGKLKEKQLTYLDVANTLGISTTAVSHKIGGTSDFYISEAKALANKFNLNYEIFF